MDGDGYVYLVDTRFIDSENTVHDRVLKFAPYGLLETKWGREGLGTSEFDYPFGIAVDSKGDLYVADSENNRIQKFHSDGTYVTQWGLPGSSRDR